MHLIENGTIVPSRLHMVIGFLHPVKKYTDTPKASQWQSRITDLYSSSMSYSDSSTLYSRLNKNMALFERHAIWFTLRVALQGSADGDSYNTLFNWTARI